MGSELKVQFTNDNSLIKQIMTDEVLFKASMPDEDVSRLETGNWEPATDCYHVVCKLRDEPIAIARLYSISNLTVDMHLHLLPKYWGTGISSEVSSKIEEFLISNTNYCKIIIQTPQCCREVLKAATREGYELEGILTSGIFWRGKVENIIIMSKFLNRNKTDG